MSALTYAGQTFIFRVDNGVVFRNTYTADGTGLHYETIEGPAKGAQETVELHAAEVVPGIFILGWVERSGMTISHVMNLNTHTVHAFWTYDPGQGRTGELHTGTLSPA
ncbi:MoaF-related domain-containing protein [Nonomuraea sp. NPDC050451]|uniref:MoaF-related domain-containing protein n=1 Tax=Nonomuraea sp. NPDC050451 TaxID=3364364 RepID=UPI00378FF242